MGTRLEINFNRLLHRCENMAKDKTMWDWRLEKYISALQDQLGDLKKCPSKPCQEVLNDYNKKVDYLRGLVEAEKMPTVSEKVKAAEKLVKVSRGDNSTPQELHFKTKVRHQKELREELFGTSEDLDESNKSGLRHRKEKRNEDDIDSLIQHHHHMQEKLAEEMLHLTRDLKQNVQDSNRIVKEDTKRITESTKVADTNLSRLKVESERLESHTKGCSWWIWIMLIVVILTFLWMILFMKIFPKK